VFEYNHSSSLCVEVKVRSSASTIFMASYLFKYKDNYYHYSSSYMKGLRKTMNTLSHDFWLLGLGSNP